MRCPHFRGLEQMGSTVYRGTLVQEVKMVGFIRIYN